MKEGLIAPAKYGNAAASTCQQTIETCKWLEQRERQHAMNADKYLSQTQIKQHCRHFSWICRNHVLFKPKSTAESYANEIKRSIFPFRAWNTLITSFSGAAVEHTRSLCSRKFSTSCHLTEMRQHQPHLVTQKSTVSSGFMKRFLTVINTPLYWSAVTAGRVSWSAGPHAAG